MPTLPPLDDAIRFSEVFERELADIRERRRLQYAASDRDQDPRENLVGLALSGGGIRSATFCLGLLQGLDRLRLLRVFDYLSTVSGGGFIGGWLSAWLMRLPPGRSVKEPIIPVEQLEPSREGEYLKGTGEAGLAAGTDPVHHLRLFSNYLTPRKGLLSGDTWRAAATISRNLVLTWLVLLPVILAAILIGQFYYVAQRFSTEVAKDFTRGYIVERVEPAARGGGEVRVSNLHIQGPGSANVQTAAARAAIKPDWPTIRARAGVAAEALVVPFAALVAATVLWMSVNNGGLLVTHVASFFAVFGMIVGVSWIVAAHRLASPSGGCGSVLGCLASRLANPGPWDYVMLGLTLAIALALAAWSVHWWWTTRTLMARGQLLSARLTRVHGVSLIVFVFAGTVLFFAGFAHDLVRYVALLGGTVAGATWLATAGTVAGSVFTALKAAPSGGADARSHTPASLPTRIVFALTPPLVLIVLATVGAYVTHTVLRFVAEPEPDARLTVLTIEAFVGLGVCLVFAAFEAAEGRSRGARWAVALFALAAAALPVALLIGYALQEPDFSFLGQDATLLFAVGIAAAGWIVVMALALVLQRERGNWRRPTALAAGSLAALALIASLAGAAVSTEAADGDVERAVYGAIILLILALTWTIGLGWMADPNALSLHTFYRARLVRAYLGASNANRHGKARAITDTVAGDDLMLQSMHTCSRGGPYHVINTTLNLVGGRDLSTAQRTAASFTLTRNHCGALRTGYRPTAEYMDGKLTLGAAVAASGAAVSPNMGSQTPTASLSMLLALLNVRLGFWVPTPNRVHWRQSQARLWPYYLLRDMLSQTTDLTSYCYLTDGGHFDNTGLYSLVERGCRFIVVVDNGADPGPAFEDIGNAIRRCRIDFGAEIDLDLSGFARRGPSRATNGGDGHERVAATPPPSHCVVGSIRYAEAHVARLQWKAGAPRVGTLVWLKPSLLGQDPADVRQYALKNTVFPQQTTADQWFDEAQFESYRRLGEHYARCVVAAAHAPALPDDLRPDEVRGLFVRLAGVTGQCTEQDYPAPVVTATRATPPA